MFSLILTLYINLFRLKVMQRGSIISPAADVKSADIQSTNIYALKILFRYGKHFELNFLCKFKIF